MYHPDVHDPNKTGLTNEQAIQKFQLLNNAFEFVREAITV
jgi:curved DNA-binding protein CbpA